VCTAFTYGGVDRNQHKAALISWPPVGSSLTRMQFMCRGCRMLANQLSHLQLAGFSHSVHCVGLPSLQAQSCTSVIACIFPPCLHFTVTFVTVTAATAITHRCQPSTQSVHATCVAPRTHVYGLTPCVPGNYVSKYMSHITIRDV
jgi:hypothetical protein